MSRLMSIVRKCFVAPVQRLLTTTRARSRRVKPWTSPSVNWPSTEVHRRQPAVSRPWRCALEMTMGMGIPWDSHGNGNWWQNWEWEWEGMGNHLYGNGNCHYSHGNQFPSADTVLRLCNSTDDNFDLRRKSQILFSVKDFDLWLKTISVTFL